MKKSLRKNSILYNIKKSTNLKDETEHHAFFLSLLLFFSLPLEKEAEKKNMKGSNDDKSITEFRFIN